jgi:hypothetical protein
LSATGLSWRGEDEDLDDDDDGYRTSERRTIYFLPFGQFEDNAAHIFDKLIAFARMYALLSIHNLVLLFELISVDSYFLGMEVALLPTLEITSAAGTQPLRWGIESSWCCAWLTNTTPVRTLTQGSWASTYRGSLALGAI